MQATMAGRAKQFSPTGSSPYLTWYSQPIQYLRMLGKKSMFSLLKCIESLYRLFTMWAREESNAIRQPSTTICSSPLSRLVCSILYRVSASRQTSLINQAKTTTYGPWASLCLLAFWSWSTTSCSSWQKPSIFYKSWSTLSFRIPPILDTCI